MDEFSHNFVERKDVPKRLIIEIGANETNGFIKQYQSELPPDSQYQIVNVNYDILPNEQKNENPIPFGNNSVDEAVMSNVLSDTPYLDFELNDPATKERLRAFWQSFESKGAIETQSYDEILDDITVFQKMRTIDDILRVLKQGGMLRIYENYNHTRPNAYIKIIEQLQQKEGIDFIEDEEEEIRIKPLLNKENDEYLQERKKYSNPKGLKDYVPRPHNKVYKIIKKIPEG